MTDVTIGSGFQTAADDAPALKVRGYWRTVGYRLRYDYVTLFFALVIVLIALAAICAPLLAPIDPLKTSMAYRLKPIGFRNFALGTDELGRDMLSRLIYGGRMSLLMGLTPVVLATMLGGTLGVIAGFLGGSVNMLIMRTVDIFYAFPSVLLAVAISGTMGGGMSNGLIALTLVFIPPLCRIAETATTQVRNLDFVEAARASGAPTQSIIVHHILGNVLGPDAVDAAAGDLRPALRVRAARLGDLHHLALFQSGQRRPAPGHGRAHMRRTGETGMFDNVVIPGLVPGIHTKAGAGASGAMDPGDKHRDDTVV